MDPSLRVCKPADRSILAQPSAGPESQGCAAMSSVQQSTFSLAQASRVAAALGFAPNFPAVSRVSRVNKGFGSAGDITLVR